MRYLYKSFYLHFRSYRLNLLPQANHNQLKGFNLAVTHEQNNVLNV